MDLLKLTLGCKKPALMCCALNLELVTRGVLAPFEVWLVDFCEMVSGRSGVTGVVEIRWIIVGNCALGRN